jgi:hypothetical protein
MQALDTATGGMLEVRQADITPSQLVSAFVPILDGKRSADVPCGTCTACCWYGRTDVKVAEEKAEDLAHMEIERDERGAFLKHRADGACIHLGKSGGCTIHAHRPRVCRDYDCRVMSLAGLTPLVRKDHCAPLWDFPVRTLQDKAILFAARTASVPYMEAANQGKPDPPGNVLTNILKGIHDNYLKALAVVKRLEGA